jgi:hypothetical protein
MGSKIIKINDDTFHRVYESDPEVISLKAVKDRIKDLKNQLKDMKEPKKDELAEVGMAYHPYYQESTRIQIEIERLENFKKEFENIM